MKLIIISADGTIHFFIAYASQTGQLDVEKDAFWEVLDTRSVYPYVP